MNIYKGAGSYKWHRALYHITRGDIYLAIVYAQWSDHPDAVWFTSVIAPKRLDFRSSSRREDLAKMLLFLLEPFRLDDLRAGYICYRLFAFIRIVTVWKPVPDEWFVHVTNGDILVELAHRGYGPAIVDCINSTPEMVATAQGIPGAASILDIMSERRSPSQLTNKADAMLGYMPAIYNYAKLHVHGSAGWAFWTSLRTERLYHLDEQRASSEDCMYMIGLVRYQDICGFEDSAHLYNDFTQRCINVYLRRVTARQAQMLAWTMCGRRMAKSGGCAAATFCADVRIMIARMIWEDLIPEAPHLLFFGVHPNKNESRTRVVPH